MSEQDVDETAANDIAKETEIVDQTATSRVTTRPGIGSGPNPRCGNNFNIEWLDLSSTVIEEKEGKILARALERNELTELKVLFLQGNAGDVGMRAMLNALRAGHLQKLKKFILWEVSSYDQITAAEEGTDIVAHAIEVGNLLELDTMDLTGSLPKLMPARSIVQTIKELLVRCSWGTGRFLEGREICLGCLFCTTHPEKHLTSECLRCLCGGLQWFYSGDDGIRKIGRALKARPTNSLKILRLAHNYIGDKGASSLAEILRVGKLPHLDELDLRHNPVTSRGAKDLVFAYLFNPLLTVRVMLDWPNFLLKEKAAAFRDNNIRLEHRLENFEIPHASVVVDEFVEFEYYLERQPRAGRFQRHSHKLHLLCHAQHESQRYDSHKISGVGIEIRKRSLFGKSSSQQNVQRDFQLDLSDFPPLGQQSSSTNDEINSSDVVPTPRTMFSNRRTTNHPPMTRQETVLQRRTGVNRIYITSKSCGFVGAAKALGSQIGRQQCQKHYWPWQSRERTKRQMDTVKEELLMLAERKPDEFYGMFGLRQVLLLNPLDHPERPSDSGKYSRVWICQTCFLGYSDSQTSVYPITTDAEILKSTSQPSLAQGPESQTQSNSLGAIRNLR